jgi:putative transposase
MADCLSANPPYSSTRWGLIKSGFSRHIEATVRISVSRKTKGERGIWQRRFWEHLIRDDNDFERHVDYIHYNPVKHGFVLRPVDWSLSSIHRYIKQHILDEDWTASSPYGACVIRDFRIPMPHIRCTSCRLLAAPI